MAAPRVPRWQQQLLQAVGAPVTGQNLLFLNDWQRAEGGTAANNPFNTTQQAPGASSYNSVGVRNYGSPEQGIQATLETLRNGRYGNILAALRQGSSARSAAQALSNSPWGTGSLVLKMLGAGAVPAGSPQMAPSPLAAAAAGLAPASPPQDFFAPVRQALARQPTVGGSLDRTGFYRTLGTAIRQRNTAQPQRALAAAAVTTRSGTQTTPVRSGRFKIGDPVVGGTGVGGEHPTMGLDGYPARDYFAPSGSAVVAPVGGKIIRLSGHDPKLGPIEGPHGPLGWSVYIQGNDGHIYYLTHMGSRAAKVGETVKPGTVIGTVANYAKYGTPSHIHMGVH